MNTLFEYSFVPGNPSVTQTKLCLLTLNVCFSRLLASVELKRKNDFLFEFPRSRDFFAACKCHCATAAAAATSTDISLEAKETSDDPVHSARAAAGLSALHDASVSVALRTALSIEGDVFQPLSSAIKSWLADHYIHTRVSVDQHTATAIMFDSFSTSKVLVVRNFPAAMKPTWQSVRDVIIEPIPDDHTRYMYNQSRSRVHALLADRLDKRDDLQQQREWWRQINLLPDTGKLDTLSSGTLWSAISRRGKSLLHIDDTDGVSWQWSGRKV